MKMIHCADLHLGSRMESGLPAEKAKERRLELLHTFVRMTERAAEDGVESILICGDLFDGKTVSARVCNCVLDAVVQHPQITFYCLQGNHDQGGFLENISGLPDNLRTFGPDWTFYEQGDAVIAGTESSAENRESIMEHLTLEKDRINIVMLHGMAVEYCAKDQMDAFSLQKLRGKNIDYLALGHIHSFRMERLDERGVWCYCGCLEGRGFDECGQKGYVELEIDGGTVISRFVPFARRTLHEIPVDITGTVKQEEIQRRIRETVQGIPAKDMLKIRLTGRTVPEAERDPAWLEKWMEEDFYFLKIQDETTLLIHPEDYRYDMSLKGEFVRLVLNSDIPDEEKEEILRRGIQALERKG